MTQNSDTGKPLLLLFPFEQLAHYLRCLTLAKQLAPCFEIQVTYSSRYASFVQQEGFEMFDCPGPDADAILHCVKRFDFSWLNIKNLETSFKNQIAAITKLRPAVVLGDTMPTLNMAAEKTDVPYISLTNGYMSRYYAGTRKMSWRYPLYPYFKYIPSVLLDYVTKKGEQQSFYKIHQPFKQLRAQYGLSKKMSYHDELEGDMNLICDLPELFPQQPLPSNYILLPPLVYKANAPTHGLLKNLDCNKRTLFVSMGSTGDWQQVAFLNHPYFRKYNIITASDTTGVVKGAHVFATAFAHVQHLFPHVDLVLCHGGNGTIYQALQYGIPVLCKTAHFEQEWNVQALEQKKLGASLDHLRSSRSLIKMIEQWMDKKGSGPLLTVQQKLAVPTGEGIAEHIRKLLLAGAETPYFAYEKSAGGVQQQG